MKRSPTIEPGGLWSFRDWADYITGHHSHLSGLACTASGTTLIRSGRPSPCHSIQIHSVLLHSIPYQTRHNGSRAESRRFPRWPSRSRIAQATHAAVRARAAQVARPSRSAAALVGRAGSGRSASAHEMAHQHRRLSAALDPRRRNARPNLGSRQHATFRALRPHR